MAQTSLTYNGYDMYEVISTLQKEIRRGCEENAMYWGVELYISGFANWAWKRLEVMAMEDVGMANPMAIVQVRTLHQIWREMIEKKDRKKQERLAYVQAILLLVHSKKSRCVDWALNYWFDFVAMQGHCNEIPDYALDIHTRRGKALGKTIEDFFTEGTKLENYEPFSYEEWYKQELHRWWNDDEWNRLAHEAHDKLEAKNWGGKIQSAEELDNPAPVQTSLFD